jgi:hypothetical protein
MGIGWASKRAVSRNVMNLLRYAAAIGQTL